MKKLPLKQQAILPRMDGIAKDVEKLRSLAALPREEFEATENDYIDIAKTRLREALEGVFNIGAHLLSRIAGGRATEYKEIARKLGECGIVERDFANTKLIRMAGFRNRLTHFYAEITPSELYDILQNDLYDFEIFLGAVKKVLEKPEQFGVTVE